MGAVYLAQRQDIGGLVAIKILRGALSPERRKRFAREEKTLAQFNHPLIARIYDAGIFSDGTPWYVMEYVEGVPIAKYCQDHGDSVETRMQLLRSVCEAVQFAHGKAIIHRDLKPSNILVQADGNVKLLDFGIAKQLTDDTQPQERTQTWLRMLTPAYAAPEQMRGAPPTTQMDVYSLGVILYELLTADRPFDLSRKTLSEAENIIMQQEPEPPSSVAKRMLRMNPDKNYWSAGKAQWHDLDVLCLTAMHKDVDRRYGSVEALARDCDHFLKHEPLEAHPDRVSYRLDKFVRRHRRLLTIAAAVFALIVGLVMFFTVRLARARTAALAEARRTQRIEQFMFNLFYGGQKNAGPSEDLRVISLLDRGVKDAQTLNAEPVVQAELYQTLGIIYRKLGKLDQADPLLQSALQKRVALSGPGSAEAADSLVALSLLRLDQAKFDEAERLARDALATQRRRSSDTQGIAKAEYVLGLVLEERGSYDEAIKILGNAVQLQTIRNGMTMGLADSLTALGTAHYYAGHLELAASLHQQALSMVRELYGTLHPRVGEDLGDLGEIEHDLGHDAQAEQYYRQALAIFQSWYGLNHPDTALTMSAVGQSLVYQHRYDEAAPLLNQALAIQEGIFGKQHPQVAQGLNTLGLLEFKRGHLAEAEADFVRMADINRAAYGDRHLLVAVALMNIGQVHLEKHDYPVAERFYRQSLDRMKDNLPAGHPTTAIAENELGHILVAEKHYKEAEPHLLAAYGVMLKEPNPPASRLENARKDLVALYEFLGQTEEAARFRAELAAASAGASPKLPAR